MSLGDSQERKEYKEECFRKELSSADPYRIQWLNLLSVSWKYPLCPFVPMDQILLSCSGYRAHYSEQPKPGPVLCLYGLAKVI